LSANHHADVGADLGIKLGGNQNAIEQSTLGTEINTPVSNLTFYLAADGRLIDRHVSAFIRSRFTSERIQRLQTKPTQGLLWRIYGHVTIKWKTLNLYKGFLRSLLGMSNSHSRNIYKSTSYREGNLRDYLKKIDDPEMKECIKLASVMEQIKYLLPCPWCNCQSRDPQKGNRRHLILHCTNTKISNFRNRINNVVGSQIAALFLELQDRSSPNDNISLIYEIEKCFLDLQKKQVGRLLNVSKDRNMVYILVSNIIRKLQVDNVEDAIKLHPINFFLNLFHLTPDKLMVEPSDAELGVMDAVWLGLMPSSIAQIMYNSILAISRDFVDKEHGVHWKEKLFQDWKRIESLNMGRAIGLHRIMNGVGHDLKTTLIEKHHLQNVLKEAAAKRRIKAKRSSTCLQKESYKKPPKKRKTKNATEASPEICCNGITCGSEKVRWCGSSNFSPNTISIQRKQCLRCSLFTTSMKATNSILINLQEIQSHKQVKITKLLQEQKRKRNIDFTSLIHMLKTYIPSNVQFKRAQYISKNRPTEKWKRVCKLLIELATRKNILAVTTNNITSSLQKWIDDIERTIHTKNAELVHDKAFMNKCLK